MAISGGTKRRTSRPAVPVVARETLNDRVLGELRRMIMSGICAG
ncbi:hypothetical protein ACF1BQ_019315 [Bradyrhizobium sp. RDT10]